LTAHFVAKYAEERPDEKPVRRVEKEVERLFYEYGWPGNVRELENLIERAMVMCTGDIITIDDLPTDFRNNVNKNNKLNLKNLSPKATLYETLAHVEKQMILQALQQAGYVQTHAASLLGIGKSGLNQKLKKYGIDVTEFAQPDD